MDLFSLRTFVSVKELQSFSKAGDQLLLTQPAVSKRIAALELELGSRLFDRVGKKILLTEAGRELYRRAKTILMNVEDCRRALSTLSEKMSGTLSFATSHHIGLHYLPKVLLQFSSNFPEVELDISFLDSEQAYSAVTSGEVEFALVTLPERTLPQIQLLPIWHDPLAVVVGGSHHLAEKSGLEVGAVSLQALAEYPVILPGFGTYTRELITAAFTEKGLKLTEKMSTNYLETIKMLISVGLGWGVLPQKMVKGSDLCQLKAPGIDFERTLGAIHHRQRTLSKSAETMLAQLLANEEG